MNLSAILVLVSPDRFDSSIENLNGLPGVEVHHTEPSTGRMIVVQEADSVSAEVDGLRRIQNQPYVRMAELVYHYFEEDPEIETGCLTSSSNETPEGSYGKTRTGSGNLK